MPLDSQFSKRMNPKRTYPGRKLIGVCVACVVSVANESLNYRKLGLDPVIGIAEHDSS